MVSSESSEKNQDPTTGAESDPPHLKYVRIVEAGTFSETRRPMRTGTRRANRFRGLLARQIFHQNDQVREGSVCPGTRDWLKNVRKSLAVSALTGAGFQGEWGTGGF